MSAAQSTLRAFADDIGDATEDELGEAISFCADALGEEDGAGFIHGVCYTLEMVIMQREKTEALGRLSRAMDAFREENTP